MDTSILELCKLELLELLSKLRTIADVEVRRSVTKQVHSQKKTEWESHKNYHGTMAHHLVEDIHNIWFRIPFGRILQLSSLESVKVKDFEEINSNLHGHHRLEDRYMFPSMREQHPELVEEINILERDHEALVALEGKVYAGDYEAMAEYVSALNDHLNREEIIAVPLILDGTDGHF